MEGKGDEGRAEKLVPFQKYLENHPEFSASDLYEALWDGKVLIENKLFEKSGRISTAEYAKKYNIARGSSGISNLVVARRIDYVKTPDGIKIQDAPPDSPKGWRLAKNIFEIDNFTPLFVTPREFSDMSGIYYQALCARLRRGRISGAIHKERTPSAPYDWLIPVDVLREMLEKDLTLQQKKEKALRKIKGEG